jgi:uncharacterized protein YndB with AHSA1/START domain
MTDLPTASPEGTLERTAEGGVLRFQRHLPYAITEVWSAITDPARLADWWLPFDADITVDLRVGGEMVFAGRGDEPVVLRCTILQLDPPTLLRHTHGDGSSTMSWELTEVEGGCELRVAHWVPDVQAAVDGCWAVGLHTSLSRLEPCLAGSPVPWDWSEFAGTQSRYAALGLAPAATS